MAFEKGLRNRDVKVLIYSIVCDQVYLFKPIFYGHGLSYILYSEIYLSFITE